MRKEELKPFLRPVGVTVLLLLAFALPAELIFTVCIPIIVIWLGTAYIKFEVRRQVARAMDQYCLENMRRPTEAPTSPPTGPRLVFSRKS